MIHPTALVDGDAQIHEEADIGPYTIIGPNVEVGRGTRIESHVAIKGPTSIGEDNHIFQFASIGDDPQDKKYDGKTTTLELGDRNTIREYCTINRGTAQDRGATQLGSDNWLMAYAHVAHDCVVGVGFHVFGKGFAVHRADRFESFFDCLKRRVIVW